MAFIGPNDLLVLQKSDGRVRRVINGALQSGEVLDVAVHSSSERGLLGIALHPDFPTVPFVYLYYAENSILVIGGFIVEGNGPKTVLLRGRGPSLAGAPFFVPGVLADPTLRIFSGQAVIAQNDNWQDSPSCSGFFCGGVAQIIATGLNPCQSNPGQVVAPPGCTLESAILITLNPGAYTVHCTRGRANTDFTSPMKNDSALLSFT